MSAAGGLTPEQRRIVKEIRRVAQSLGDRQSLSQDEFDKHHQLGGVTTAGYQFGSWNEAVRAAGLEPIPRSRRRSYPRLTDRELLEEIIRVHRLRREPPSERWMVKLSKFSLKPYKARWGNLAKARQAAYELLGRPEGDGD